MAPVAPVACVLHASRRAFVGVILRPITRREAASFVGRHHRHNAPVVGWLFGVGLYLDGDLVAVGVAGRPSAPVLDDGLTVEVTRVCVAEGVDPTVNACSRLYGSLCRAAKALGYRSAVTYLVVGEPGTSARAAGFVPDAEPRRRTSWRRRDGQQLRLLDPSRPTEAVQRWRRAL